MDQAFGVLPHEYLLGDWVALALASIAMGELLVFVVLDDFGGNIMSNGILLGGALWGRGRACNRHASAAAVGNEIRCGWDARRPPAGRPEVTIVISGI